MKAPDGIMAVWNGDDGAVAEIPYDELRNLANSLEEVTPRMEWTFFPTEEGKAFVQARLANLVGNDKQTRALAGWSWIALARVVPAAH